ncbi:MAG TPA: L-histidine N(alpha)-methyltransferase [Acidimicrobiales bacterium]
MVERLSVRVCLPADHRRVTLEHDLRTGLARRPKTLSPLWFYDERGSALFDRITRLPEYYLTRAERSILDVAAGEIVGAAGCDQLVELGSGTSEKTRLLLDAMSDAGRLRRFVPLDVSEATLREAAADISRSYGIAVHAVVGDFHQHLDCIPADGNRLVAFLGSTIGNLDPGERSAFLRALAATLGPGDRLLLGTDLVKDPGRLLAAYDDRAGVTAEFNRNMLRVLNAEAGGDFDPDQFDHLAVWDEASHWIEMRLRSRSPQTVRLARFGLEVSFREGEDLRTEISSKFTAEQVEMELWGAGLAVEQTWTDPDKDFQLSLSRLAGQGRS